MGFNLSYPVSKPFNKIYTITIAFGMALCFTAVGFWNHLTKNLDCEPYTSGSYTSESCYPKTITNKSQLWMKNTSFPVVISGLQQDYAYHASTFTCSRSTDFRVVQHSTRTTDFYLNADCTFNDTTEFSLAVRYTGQMLLAYTADLANVDCGFGVKAQLESIIFDSYDDGPIFIGVNVTNSCTIPVSINSSTHVILPNYRGQTDPVTLPMSIEKFYNYQKEVIATKSISGYDWVFDVSYICETCTPKPLARFIYDLLVAFGSIGAIVYRILIYIGKRLYEREKPKDEETERLYSVDLEMHGRGIRNSAQAI